MVTNLEPLPTDREAIRRPALAPWQHTVFLVVVLGLWALYGALHSRLAPTQLPLFIRYISGIVMQTLLVGTALAGVYHRRTFVFDLLGYSATRALWKDLAIGFGILATGTITVIATRLVLRSTLLYGTRPSDAVRALLPSTVSELAAWLLVAMTAGFCEEFIFRGYLQRQVTEWSGSLIAGIALPTLLFGALHLYQGIASAIGITLLGLVYAICANRFGNLRGVIIAHALQDFLAGLIHFVRGV